MVIVDAGRTSNAAVVDLQVALELLVARSDAIKRRFDDLQRAASSTRAAPVEKVKDVGEAAHEAEVGLDAASEPHATVQRRRHENELVVRAASVERLVVAVLLGTAERRRDRHLLLSCTRKRDVIGRQVRERRA